MGEKNKSLIRLENFKIENLKSLVVDELEELMTF